MHFCSDAQMLSVVKTAVLTDRVPFHYSFSDFLSRKFGKISPASGGEIPEPVVKQFAADEFTTRRSLKT